MDLHIIGAGPAGIISAITASRNNSRVILSEEHMEAGFPVNCSGLVSKSGLNSLKEFIDYKKSIKGEFNGAILNFSGAELKVESPEIMAYVLDRSSFDKELASNAEKEGVKINYNERIAHNFYSNNIIGADGPNSSIARIFNFPKIEKFVSTSQTIIPYKTEDKNKVQLFYSNELFSGFFGWIIPLNEEESEIGCGSVLPFNSKKGFNLFMKQLGLQPKETTHYIIPIKTRPCTSYTFGKRKVLLVGDAAGQTKATSGGGIVFGGNCAKIAGNNFQNPEEYESEWRMKFGFDLSTHSLIQSFIEKRSEEGLRRIGNFLNSTKIDSYLSKNGDMDKPSKMLNFNLLAHFLKNLF